MLYGHSMVQAFADQHPLGILMKQTRVLPGQLRTNPIFLETIVLVYLNTATTYTDTKVNRVYVFILLLTGFCNN